MNLRWLEKEDGGKVLQYLPSTITVTTSTNTSRMTYYDWIDIPTEKAPRKAREWWMRKSDGFAFDAAIDFDRDKYIKVREVLE